MNHHTIKKIAENLDIEEYIVEDIIRQYLFTPYEDGKVMDNILLQVLKYTGLKSEEVKAIGNTPQVVRARRIFTNAIVQFFREKYGKKYIDVFRIINVIPLYMAIAKMINRSRTNVYYYHDYNRDTPETLMDMRNFNLFLKENKLKLGYFEKK